METKALSPAGNVRQSFHSVSLDLENSDKPGECKAFCCRHILQVRGWVPGRLPEEMALESESKEEPACLAGWFIG